MSDRDRTTDENAALRARISALSAASLRINASLDLETVLNEVVESARALTGARYGAIATIDDAGVPQDFVTSGFTSKEKKPGRSAWSVIASGRALSLKSSSWGHLTKRGKSYVKEISGTRGGFGLE